MSEEAKKDLTGVENYEKQTTGEMVAGITQNRAVV